MSVQGDARSLTTPDVVAEPAEEAVLPETTPSSEDGWDRLGRALERFMPTETHVRLLWLLMLVTVLLRILWLGRPDNSLIFDEKYYVNAARMIAGIPPQADIFQDKPLGLDPNTEHPPLAKVMVAGTILLFGDNAYGWRIPSVIFGSLAVLLMYGVSRRVGASTYTALAAAMILSFDNLVFVHGRIFTLDIFQLAFMLLGMYWYLKGRATLAGAGFALAALCKIGGTFGVLAVFGYEALRVYRGDRSWRDAWRPAARRLTRMTVTFALVFLVLLGAMDRLWVGYSTPFEHLDRIFSYGMLLRRAVPSGIESYPWQWLWNETQIPYLKVEQQIKIGDEVKENRPVFLFLGAMNPYVLTLWPFGLAFVGYLWWHRQKGATLGALALAWFVMNYLPFYYFSIVGQRISYLFYFLPTLPAIALAGGYFLVNGGLPRIVTWAYLAAILLGFYGYFPFKPVA